MSITDAVGHWDIVIATPMGRQEVTLEIAAVGSALTGTARTSQEESIEVYDGAFDGEMLVCRVDLKKPLPLTVTYRLTIDGDMISGTAKAGPFPTSKVTGSRAKSS